LATCEKYDIHVIYLSELSERDGIQNPSETPMVVTRLRDGELTVAYVSGDVARIPHETLRGQMQQADLQIPPAAYLPREADL
jgi:hypothetical protein